MNIETIIKLRKSASLLMQIMEILNEIDEREYAKLVKIARTQTTEIRNIEFSLQLGNMFMVIFRLREWIEHISIQANMPRV